MRGPIGTAAETKTSDDANQSPPSVCMNRVTTIIGVQREESLMREWVCTKPLWKRQWKSHCRPRHACRRYRSQGGCSSAAGGRIRRLEPPAAGLSHPPADGAIRVSKELEDTHHE